MGFLLEVARRGDARLRQIAGMALASQGDEHGKATLMQAIAEGEVPVEVLPKDMIDALVGSRSPQRITEKGGMRRNKAMLLRQAEQAALKK